MGHEPIALVWIHLKQCGRRSSSGSTNNLTSMPKSCSSVCRKACPALSRPGNYELSNEESNSGAVKSHASWYSVLNQGQLWNMKCAPAPPSIPRKCVHDQLAGFQIDQTRCETGICAPALSRRASAKRKRSISGCCPIHRGEGRDAFHVNLVRNVSHCFACGAGGTVLDFVAAMEGCSLFDAAQRLQSMTCSSNPLTLKPNAKELVTERRKVSSPLNFKLTGIDCAHPYLAERGITEKTAIEFGVGFAGPGLMHGRLVIPIHNTDGELVAYCGRSVDQTEPRYRVPLAFAKSEIPLNMHRAGSGGDSSVVDYVYQRLRGTEINSQIG
jgi:hypothetical protein